ncbi:hypothetical protein [Methylobacterium sp. MA0201]|uniref:hypothetical protein n=1 Tax=Methylobacterium alsaeris TaxID=3344826 RepID=UPI00375653B3
MYNAYPDNADAAELRIVAIERIGRAIYGDLWIGKIAADIGIGHQTIRRWLAGRGSPGSFELNLVLLVAKHHAARVMRAIEAAP